MASQTGRKIAAHATRQANRAELAEMLDLKGRRHFLHLKESLIIAAIGTVIAVVILALI